MARVAILTSEFLPFHGGIGTYARELAAAAAALGHDVTVFAPDYGRMDHPDDRTSGFHVRRFRAGLHSPLSYPVYARVALQAARVGKFDRILAASVPFAEMLAATAAWHRRPYDIAVHGSDINKQKHSLRGRVFRPFGIFRRPHRIFANSTFTRDLLRTKFPNVDAARIEVVYPGVVEKPSIDIPDIRTRLGIERNRRVIVMVARIAPRKGQHVLLEAVAGWPSERRERVALVLIGTASGLSPDYELDLVRAAAAAQPAQTVRIERLSDPEIQALYRAADIFCLPGAVHPIEVEGFGLVLLEAAMQGLPAVAGHLGGVPEIVRDNETGLLVAPGDRMALAAALQRMLDDEALRAKLGHAAREAARHFTWDRCARQIFGTVRA